MVINEEQDRKDEFLAILQSLERGTTPHFTAQQAADADAKLNAVYQRIQRATPMAIGDTLTVWGTVTKNGIRTAQRAWLRYRDAWVAFVRVKYPAVTMDSIRAALTNKRTATLEGFVP